jgi:hypothetical protein
VHVHVQVCRAVLDFAAALESGSYETCCLPHHSAAEHNLPECAAAFAQANLSALLNSLQHHQQRQQDTAAIPSVFSGNTDWAAAYAQPGMRAAQGQATGRAVIPLRPINIGGTAKKMRLEAAVDVEGAAELNGACSGDFAPFPGSSMH